MVRVLKLPQWFVGLLFAVTLWYFTFATFRENFWLTFLFSSAVLALYGVVMGGDRRLRMSRYEAAIAFWVAVALYVFFFVFNFIFSLFETPREWIEQIYDSGGGVPWYYLTVILVLVAIFEEFFWRGYILRALADRMNPLPALILGSLLYALVHVIAGNPLLIVAAFIAGAVFGLLYLVTKSLLATIFCHALFTVAAFVVMPFR